MNRVSGNSAVAPAREVAYAVIRRVFEHRAYADRTLSAQLTHRPQLAPRDRALATTLVYGTVQRTATLDYVAGRLCTRPLHRLDPSVLAALRLSLFQLLFLDRVAHHAAVDDGVELAKRNGGGGATLVNAVLRRATREGAAILHALGDQTPAEAALAHSVPRWLAELWWEELGPAQTRALLQAVNEPAEAALRVNELVSTREEVLARLPVTARPAPQLREGIVLQESFDVHGSELFATGAIMPQSRASMLVARALAPRSGQRVLDLCAAPGAKTTHLAALMAGEGEILAVERHPGRARALERTCDRLRAQAVRVRIGDATRSWGDGTYDRVLVDPPCSGLGTLQSRPDLRWRGSRDSIRELSRLQARILAAGAAATAPGGALVYSVCTISQAESSRVIDAFLDGQPEFRAEALPTEWSSERGREAGPYLQLRPERDGTDGFFIARLRRDDAPRS